MDLALHHWRSRIGARPRFAIERLAALPVHLRPELRHRPLQLHDALVERLGGHGEHAVGIHHVDAPLVSPSPKAARKSCAMGPRWRTDPGSHW